MAPPTTSKPLRLLVALGVLIVGLLVWAFWPGTESTVRLGLDLQGGTQVILQPKPVTEGAEITEEQLTQTVSIIRQRVDGLGVAEAEVTTQGSGNGAVIIAESGAVSLEILLLPLTLHRFTGRRVLGVVADCNPYAQPGETNPLKIVSCRFLARDLQEISPQTSYSSDAQNPALTAPTHSQAIRSAAGRQKLTLKLASRFLQ